MPEGAGRGHRVRLSGGTILNIYDELYRHPEIHHILTSHEQGAAHAADGYARATGKTGVCMATSGPGATNLVTGIATAYMDSTPMVAITCNVGKALLGKDSFQEIDIAGVAMPITKYSVIVKDITVLADTLRRAFSIAKSGRPGPVLVDITKDVTAATYEYEPKDTGSNRTVYRKNHRRRTGSRCISDSGVEKTVYFRGRRQYHLRRVRGSARTGTPYTGAGLRYPDGKRRFPGN